MGEEKVDGFMCHLGRQRVSICNQSYIRVDQIRGLLGGEKRKDAKYCIRTSCL